jgi:hypothetical protein
MALPPSNFAVAHAVLGFAAALSREPAETEQLTAELRSGFPNLIARPLLPPEAPLQTPHLTVASTSAQLAISAIQADFEVRFYGDYLNDLDKSLEYVERKVQAVHAALRARGITPSMIGIVGTFNFSFGLDGLAPADHILATQLNVSVDPGVVQEAVARIAVKVRDTYFVSMTLSNVEQRVFERPLMPNVTNLWVKPWEGQIRDRALALTLDINNVLEGRQLGRDPVVTEEGIGAVIRMLREVAHTSGPLFAESGTVDVESLTASSTA